MNKEIEELLNMLKKCAREDKATLKLNEIACKTILSYIEQLQTTANECKQDYQRMKDNFDSKVDVITELKEDIEEYNDKLNQVVKERNKLINENKILKENAEHNDKVVDKVNWENKQLENNRDKAIEYIEDMPTCLWNEAHQYNYDFDKLIDILKGDSYE